MNIKIVSDGTTAGTRALTETGEALDGIRVIDWHLEAGGLARVQLEVIRASVELTGEMDIARRHAGQSGIKETDQRIRKSPKPCAAGEQY